MALRPTHEQQEPSWKPALQVAGVMLLAVAHITALVVGGYDEWPTWAAVLNFGGLAFLTVPAVIVRLRR